MAVAKEDSGPALVLADLDGLDDAAVGNALQDLVLATGGTVGGLLRRLGGSLADQVDAYTALFLDQAVVNRYFLHSQAEALLTCDLFDVRTLTGARLYVFTTIEHSTRRIRILGATPHPTADRIVQLGRNLLMDLDDAGSKARFLIRDRDSKLTAAFDALITDAGIKVVTTGIHIPRMNSLMER